MRMQKIGLLGGTFDPVHVGHLQLAEAVLDECGLDKIIFIPSAEPPHKNESTITPFEHRVAMLELISENKKQFECNSIEGGLAKPSYTIDTLRVMREEYENIATLSFIIGADAFLDIATWKSYQKIPYLVKIILSPRKGFSNEKLFEILKMLGYESSGGRWLAATGQKDISILESTPINLSSSTIRSLISQGEPVQHLLPKAVFDYLTKHSLYRPGNEEKI